MQDRLSGCTVVDIVLVAYGLRIGLDWIRFLVLTSPLVMQQSITSEIFLLFDGSILAALLLEFVKLRIVSSAWIPIVCFCRFSHQ